jgi:hypothetical protein
MGTIKKHSKYKNTGILFELLVRQVTADMITDRDSRAVKIIKKFFTGSELLKEYKLYTVLLKASNLSETKAETLTNTVIEESKKLDRDVLDKEKFNLIREIKKYYDVENFFKAKVDRYKLSAAIYTLFEAARSKAIANTDHILLNRTTLLEHLTYDPASETNDKTQTVDSFLKEDKDIRILAYKLIVEKYNDTYKELSQDQKEILKEYINNVSDTQQLRTYLNTKTAEIKSQLQGLLPKVEDQVMQIKLKEVLSLMKPVLDRQSIKDEHLVSLLQYCELLKELKTSK